MFIENSESMRPIFLLGLVETAINYLLEKNTQCAQIISSHAGKVIRVKLYSPHYSFYFILCEEGVQVLSQFDGVVDARIKAPASQIVWLLLGETADPQTLLAHLTATGDQALINDLIRLVLEVNVWHSIVSFLQEWMPDYPGFIKKIASMNSNASLWADNMQGLSQLTQETLSEMRQQSHSQARLLNELIEMRRTMEKNSLRHSIQFWLGLVLMAVVWFIVMK